MVFPYYPRPEDDEQEPDEEQQREESRRRFNRARFEQIRRRYERMRQRRQLQDPTRTLTAEQLEYQHDSESYRRPTSAPVSRPSTRPTPTSSPYDYADPPASQSSGQGSSSDPGKQSKSGKSDDEDNSPANSAPVTDKRDLASDAYDEEPTAEAVWQDYTPLTPGQQMHVDNLLSIETDNLAREVLITLKREGLPPNDQWREFLEQYALTGWYAASDAIAWATLAKIANSEWDKTLAYADEGYVETAAQDLGDNAIEGVVVIDAETGDTLFDRTGVVRADGSQYVGMQDTEADALLAEALSGRDLVFVHNHTEEIGASDEDLDSAFAAGAKLLIVITPQGQEYVYIRGRNGMVEVRDDKASYEVGPANPDETEELRIRSEAQAWAFQVDSPELIFLQDDPEVIANMDVNPDEIPQYKDLEAFVNMSLTELQALAVENPMVIDENIELLKTIFGYDIMFYGSEARPADFYKEGNIEDKQSAMEQVHNLGTILYHFLNDLGKEIMESTAKETIYILGADERIRELHNVEDYAFRGHVALPESTAKGSPDLKIVYLGSEIEAGAIGHEVAHEIDRRAGDLSSVSKPGEPPPVGSLEWFLWNKVQNRLQPTSHYGYNFRMASSYLNPGSRAARKEDYDSDREIFADIMPAKILGPMDEEYFSRADTDVAIGFKATSNAKDTACGIEQYYDQYAKYREHGTPEPKDFVYDPELCE